jgi:hypothetical protein
VYEFARQNDFGDPRLMFAVLAAVVIALVGVVWYLYRRDAVELPRTVGVTLALLRLVALGGLVVYFLGIERRATREVVHNSQVVLLIDVSQSMGLAASDEPAVGGGQSRLDEVVAALAESRLINDLRRTHDVHVVRFDRNIEPLATLPMSQQPQPENAAPTPANSANDAEPVTADFWSAKLQPRGTETRLGEALAEIIRIYRDAPLAGIVVISDGAQNAGVEPTAAVEAASQHKIPFFSVGLGSTEPQRNVAIRDLVIPTRAFPGDTLSVTGFVQASGYAGRWVDVQLGRRRAGEREGPQSASSQTATPLGTERVALKGDGEMTDVSFNVDPGEAGTFVYELRVVAPADDANARDNQREAEVEVVDRRTRVLLFASGPMRDYQYLRNQLHRDKSMTVDVLLQSAQSGASQDAGKILSRFPATREELYPYDCVVAFDPDWSALDAAQAALLESWVAEEAGGLIVVAGPIHTANFVRSAEHAKLRDLYPVVFQSRTTLIDDGQYGGTLAWPLEFDRAGREAKFLWLDKTAELSAAAWARFPGVYGYFNIKQEKPGATVYARFSDPAAGSAASRPVYFASQFYGAGQVFYIGSGELWRLRSVDPAFFEVLYTKLIRHVSQGRILRGSSRGALMVERDRYELGESVVLRARVSDERHNPLVAESVTAHALRPNGQTEPVKLAAQADRPGMFVGQLTVLQEGTYQVALSLAGENEPLSRFLQVRVPDRERTRAERNEELLTKLAADTGGTYYSRLASAIDGDGPQKPLAQTIRSRAERKPIKGTPDQDFAEMQMRWLLGVIAGALCLEWIVRRLNRLA